MTTGSERLRARFWTIEIRRMLRELNKCRVEVVHCPYGCGAKRLVVTGIYNQIWRDDTAPTVDPGSYGRSMKDWFLDLHRACKPKGGRHVVSR